MKDVAVLKKRKQMREMGRTVQGRLWLAAGWALSVYCVWRVFIVCLLFSSPFIPCSPYGISPVLYQPLLRLLTKATSGYESAYCGWFCPRWNGSRHIFA